VWNYDNRERVRRDEEAAQKEEGVRQARSNAADQEVRLDVMRARAASLRRTSTGEESGASPAALESPEARRQYDGVRHDALVYAPSGQDHVSIAAADDATAYPALRDPAAEVGEGAALQHINLFEDIERGTNKRNGASIDLAREQKREEDATLKKVGALVYLGQTVLDAKAAPWYDRTAAESAKTPTTADHGHPRKRQRTTASTHNAADPMAAMRKYVRSKGEHDRTRRRQLSAHDDGKRELADERTQRERDARAQVTALFRSPEQRRRPDHNAEGYSQGYSHYHHDEKSDRPRAAGVHTASPCSPSREKKHKKEKKGKKAKSKKEKKAKKSKRDTRRERPMDS
jgi:hypothetical protein